MLLLLAASETATAQGGHGNTSEWVPCVYEGQYCPQPGGGSTSAGGSNQQCGEFACEGDDGLGPPDADGYRCDDTGRHCVGPDGSECYDGVCEGHPGGATPVEPKPQPTRPASIVPQRRSLRVDKYGVLLVPTICNDAAGCLPTTYMLRFKLRGKTVKLKADGYPRDSGAKHTIGFAPKPAQLRQLTKRGKRGVKATVSAPGISSVTIRFRA